MASGFLLIKNHYKGRGDRLCVIVLNAAVIMSGFKRIGKFVSMVSSIFGIAIVALPSGIITAGYMEELSKVKKEKDDRRV